MEIELQIIVKIAKRIGTIYEHGAFAIAEKAAPAKTFGELSDEEKENFTEQNEAEIEGSRKRHKGILQTLNAIQQSFSKSKVHVNA